MNILYVLDSICQQSLKASFSGYTDLLQRSLPKVIDYVAPTGPKGNVNVAGTKKVISLFSPSCLLEESKTVKLTLSSTNILIDSRDLENSKGVSC